MHKCNYIYVHVLMRDERRKDERSKQSQTKNKVKQHSTLKTVTFPKKNELHRYRVGHVHVHVYTHVDIICCAPLVLTPPTEYTTAPYRALGGFSLFIAGYYIYVHCMYVLYILHTCIIIHIYIYSTHASAPQVAVSC